MIRVAATAVLACLVLAPAAEASKRSEARRYAAALREYAEAERDIAAASTPAYHARRDAVVDGCLDVVSDGAPQQFLPIVLLYGAWSVAPVVEAAQPEADRLVRRLREWQSAGWKPADEPASAKRLFELDERMDRRYDAALERGRRFLRRHGVGIRVAAVFEDGTAGSYDALWADDPVFSAIEDAVNP